jgi:site-specific recombinase XerD
MCPFSAQDPVKNSIPSLDDLVSKYLFFMSFVKTASPETLRAYRTDLGQAFGLDGEALALKIQQTGKVSGPRPTPKNAVRLPEGALLSACRDAQSQWARLSPATRNRKAACLKSFLNWLHSEGLIERDLASQIHAPKTPHRLPHHLSVDEALTLLKSVEGDQKEARSEEARQVASRDLALILLLYGGGLRVSEACSLTWAQMDQEAKTLRIKGKGGQERLVALPPLASKALLALEKAGRHVFGNPPISTRAAYDVVRSRGARAGLLKPLHPHALRHSFATHLLSSGANLRTLQELLGHRTLQATQRYTHLGIDQLARTLEQCHPLSSDKGQDEE